MTSDLLKEDYFAIAAAVLNCMSLALRFFVSPDAILKRSNDKKRILFVQLENELKAVLEYSTRELFDEPLKSRNPYITFLQNQFRVFSLLQKLTRIHIRVKRLHNCLLGGMFVSVGLVLTARLKVSWLTIDSVVISSCLLMALILMTCFFLIYSEKQISDIEDDA